MLSTILALALSTFVSGAGTATGIAAGAGFSARPSADAEQFALIEKIEAKCRPVRVPTQYEKLTASTAPLLRYQACIDNRIAASPNLKGWVLVPMQVPATPRK